MPDLESTLLEAAGNLDWSQPEKSAPAETPIPAEPEVADDQADIEAADSTTESGDTPEPEPEPRPESTRAPSSWSGKARAKWDSIDPEIREEIAKREGDFHKGLEEYKENAGRYRELEKTIAPYLANIQSSGVQPGQAISNLLAFEHGLRNGTPEQKLNLVAAVARQYGIDLHGLTQKPEDRPYIDPEVVKVQQELAAIKQREQAREQASRKSQEDSLMEMVNTFSKAEGHDYFEQVKPLMASFLQTGQAQDLQQAYDLAVWANPETRALLQAKQQEVERKATAKAQAKKGNGVNVSRRGMQPTAKGGKPVSLDETLRAAFLEITNAA